MLEHVSGGELFDYLVRKGRLSEKEVTYFQLSVNVFCYCSFVFRPEGSLDR